MKILLSAFALLLASSHCLFAQQNKKMLQASSNKVSIREGNSNYRDQWSLSPQLKPDVFVTNPFKDKQKIVFYSDVDTLTFNVTPNNSYDFIIVNGKDTAYTQISTFVNEKPTLTPKLIYSKTKNKVNEPDTLHFKLGKDNYIHFKGNVNGSDSLDIIFDTGASMSAITAALLKEKVQVKNDRSVTNNGADGVSTISQSLSNTIGLNGITLKNVPLLIIDYKGFPFDLVLGWVAFEDKVVEIDYDKNLLIIHQNLPAVDPSYAKTEMKMLGGIPYIKCKLVVAEKESEGWFDFDTGSDGTLSISQKFASQHQLNGAMKKLGTSQSKGSAGIAFTQQHVLLPKIVIGKYELYQISMHINDIDPAGIATKENIGNKLLKRFNAIIDFKSNQVYLRPNSLLYSAI